MFWGCALFWATSCQKSEILDPQNKNRKNCLIIEKLFFGAFLVFLFFMFIIFYYFGGFLFLCLFFKIFEGLRIRWGGPKGHLAWPWALIIIFLLFWGVLFSFFSLFASTRKEPVYAPKKGIVVYFSASPLFFLVCFPSLFLHFLCLSLSLSLFLSLVLPFFSSFFSCIFAFFCFLDFSFVFLTVFIYKKRKANLDQIITPQKAKLGPDKNTYIYIYIYIAVKLLSGPSLGFSKVIIWAKFVFLNTACTKTL